MTQTLTRSKRRPGAPVGHNGTKYMKRCAEQGYITLTDRRQRIPNVYFPRMLLAMNCPRLKFTPGEDDASYKDTLDKIHETMCRAMVHNIDGSTTRNTGCVFTTNRLLATNYPRLKMTPGEYDASYGGTRIGGDLHDAVAISDGHTRRKDEDILRRSAVWVAVDIPTDMNCTVVELSDVTFTEQDMNWSDIEGDPAVSEPCDRLYRRRSFSPNRARTEVGGLIHKQIMLFRRTNFLPNKVRRNGSDSV